MGERLKQIRRELALKQSDIALVLGCRTANIAMIETGKSALSERNKKLLVQKLNLNPEWFLSDDVPMLSPTAEYDSKVQDTPRSVRGSVPLFDIHRVPDLASLFRYTVENRGKIGRKRLHPGRMTVLERIFEPVGFISIPGVNGCDGGLTIAGDGMAPAIRSGDVVIYRQLDSVSEILWGEMYLLSIDVPSGEYVAVRYLHRSENPGSAIMTGENRAFADTEIALSDITAIALVKASVRMNSAK